MSDYLEVHDALYELFSKAYADILNLIVDVIFSILISFFLNLLIPRISAHIVYRPIIQQIRFFSKYFVFREEIRSDCCSPCRYSCSWSEILHHFTGTMWKFWTIVMRFLQHHSPNFGQLDRPLRKYNNFGFFYNSPLVIINYFLNIIKGGK